MTKKSEINELILYVFFGILTTVVGYGSYIYFIHILSMTVFMSNTLSWFCAVIFAFITNKLWVFKSKSFEIKLLIKEAVAFFVSRLFTGIIEIILVPTMAKMGFDNIFYEIFKKMNISVEILFTEGIYSKLIMAVVVVILNYFFPKFFIFKKKSKEE